jgi:transcriptional repressor NrdR
MRCPFCGHLEDKVVDSRASKEADKIRRRRECQACERRYTTYERIEEVFPQIIKSDGSREEYDREKLWQGIRIACTKRPISVEEIDGVVDAVEKQMIDQGNREVSSDWIGSTVTGELRDLDPVAYIRFASVYRAFSDIQAFLEELRDLDEDSQPDVVSSPVKSPESNSSTGRQSCPDSGSKGANESTESSAG